jgi:hypothetical protein
MKKNNLTGCFKNPSTTSGLCVVGDKEQENMQKTIDAKKTFEEMKLKCESALDREDSIKIKSIITKEYKLDRLRFLYQFYIKKRRQITRNNKRK